MIDALIAGKLHEKPKQGTGKNGNTYTTAKVRVAAGNSETLLCGVIALAIKHIARNYGKLTKIPYQQTEQFRRIKAMLQEVLLRTTGKEVTR